MAIWLDEAVNCPLTNAANSIDWCYLLEWIVKYNKKTTSNIKIDRDTVLGLLLGTVLGLLVFSVTQADFTLFGAYHISYTVERVEPMLTPTPEPTPTAMPVPTPYIEVDDVTESELLGLGIKPEYIPLVVRMGRETGIGSRVAAGILLTENRSQNPAAINVNTDGSADYGLWQVNGIAEHDPAQNTDRAIGILNNKRLHLAAFGYPEPPLGLLVRSYNMGAAGALSYNNGYDAKVFGNARMGGGE